MMFYVIVLLEKVNAAHGNDAGLEIECLPRIYRLQFVKRYNSRLSDIFILLRAAPVCYRAETADISQRGNWMVEIMQLTMSRRPKWELGTTAPDRFSIATAFMLMMFGQLINIQYLTVLLNPKEEASVRREMKMKLTLKFLASVRMILWQAITFPYLAVVLSSIQNAILVTRKAIRENIKRISTEIEAIAQELVKKAPAKFDRSLTIEFEQMLFADPAIVMESQLPSGIDCASQAALFS